MNISRLQFITQAAVAIAALVGLKAGSKREVEVDSDLRGLPGPVERSGLPRGWCGVTNLGPNPACLERATIELPGPAMKGWVNRYPLKAYGYTVTLHQPSPIVITPHGLPNGETVASRIRREESRRVRQWRVIKSINPV